MIVMIYMKQWRTADCGNYRDISRLNVAGNFLVHVLLVRLQNFVANMTLPETKCSFCTERTTTNDFCSPSITRKDQRTITSVDLAKVFDTVNREMLWKILAILKVS